MKQGKVYLVGAGPGDPKLITLKGLECISKADVLVYDRLAGNRLLSYAKPGAELVYVGKHPDRHTMPQEEINVLLVDRARQGMTVTRLKGGDPFIFGRGGEEAEYLADHGIEYEVVPGVSSAIAAPAYAGIPLTHRDFTSSVGIFTGHERPDKQVSSLHWDRIATGIGTLVFLMGMENLEHITRLLMENGRTPDTPVAVVFKGTTAEQRTLVGTLGDIVSKVAQSGFGAPAVIVVGNVVRLREKLRWYENKPLFGRRVIVTRSRAQASVLSQMIEDLGGESVEFPVIKIVPPEDWAPLDEAIRGIGDYRWVVFTSINGVESFWARLQAMGKDARHLAGIKLCAIGPQTAEGLTRIGLQADLVPEEYTAETIVDRLGPLLAPGDKVLLARADIAREVLPAKLRDIGVHVEEVTAYRTVADGEGSERIRQLLAKRQVDAVSFTSSSTVRNFVQLMGEKQLSQLMHGVMVACIGPVTAETAERMGLRVDVVAREYTISGLVEAIVRYFSQKFSR